MWLEIGSIVPGRPDTGYRSILPLARLAHNAAPLYQSVYGLAPSEPS